MSKFRKFDRPGRPQGFGRKRHDKFAPAASDSQPPAAERPAPRRPAPQVDLPKGVPTVYLKSASYGAFIYNRMIDRLEGAADDGDIVAAIDKYGRFFGWGYYHSRSQIALRMFSHDTQPPDENLLVRRIAQAVRLRRETLDLEKTTDAYRLLHAEGDGLSGLIADRFGKYVVLELFSLAMYRRLNRIEDAIVDAGLDVKDFIVRADKHVMEQEGFSLPKVSASKDLEVVITENGVKFNVLLSRGHKTGFFCDQRENRLALTQFTPGKDVLDICCYSGGFTCYAGVLGSAKSLTAVDLDEKALAVAQGNAKLNNLQVDFHHADAFEFLRDAQRQGKTWPVVIVDPSKFVSRRDQIEVGLNKYADLNRLACQVVAPGGLLLTCSCSGLVDQKTFVETLGKSSRSAARPLQIFRMTGAGPDHPVMAESPESLYLKAVWARVL